MGVRDEYFKAIDKHNFDASEKILFREMLNNPSYKSVNDYGIMLSDIDDSGVNVKLTKEEANKFGKLLIKLSFYKHPDITNGNALQMVCLEKGHDYKSVIDMEKYALQLNDFHLLNNIAYSKYMTGDVYGALCLQNEVRKLCLENVRNSTERDIIELNLFVYKLFSETNATLDYKLAEEIFKSDEIFDYIGAVLTAILFNDSLFVKSNLPFLNNYFLYDRKIKKIISDYLKKGEIPNINNEVLKSNLLPKTIYANSFYLREE